MNFKNVFSRRNRILLAELVRTDFKLRYQASALGYLWSILNPLMLFAILYIVFDKFLGVGRGIEHYPVYLLLGIVLWRFFTETTNNGLASIVKRGSLIRKINFPKYIIVISGTISSLINLMINLVVVIIFGLINGVDFHRHALLIIPLIAELYIFSLSISFFLAAVNVRLRDIGYLWDVLLQAAFYATPIIYSVKIIVEKSQLAAQLMMINPVAQVIQDARHVVVTDQSVTLYDIASNKFIVFVPIILIVFLSIFTSWYFKKSSKKFAEDI